MASIDRKFEAVSGKKVTFRLFVRPDDTGTIYLTHKATTFYTIERIACVKDGGSKIYYTADGHQLFIGHDRLVVPRYTWTDPRGKVTPLQPIL